MKYRSIRGREIHLMISLFIQGHFKTTGTPFHPQEFLAGKEAQLLSQLYEDMRTEGGG